MLKNAHIKDLNDTTIQVMTSSIPKMKPEQDLKKRQARPRWHYGIRSRSDPLEIMLEIYNALSRTPIKFKPKGPFTIKCFYQNIRNSTVKFEVQLYKIELGNYLVDFRIVKNFAEGTFDVVGYCVFTFFDACMRLITELAVSN